MIYTFQRVYEIHLEAIFIGATTIRDSASKCQHGQVTLASTDNTRLEFVASTSFLIDQFKHINSTSCLDKWFSMGSKYAKIVFEALYHLESIRSSCVLKPSDPNIQKHVITNFLTSTRTLNGIIRWYFYLYRSLFVGTCLLNESNVPLI